MMDGSLIADSEQRPFGINSGWKRRAAPVLGYARDGPPARGPQRVFSGTPVEGKMAVALSDAELPRLEMGINSGMENPCAFPALRSIS